MRIQEQASHYLPGEPDVEKSTRDPRMLSAFMKWLVAIRPPELRSTEETGATS